MLHPEGFLVYPDPVTSSDILGGACFLYFKSPLFLTLPPMVVIEEPYEIITLINQRRPQRAENFSILFGSWRLQQNLSNEMLTLLEPLKGKCFKTIWTVYNADIDALKKSEELVKSKNLLLEDVFPLINPYNACGEIIRHIMLESFLELKRDINSLFDYCGEILSSGPIEDLLVKGYLLRVSLLNNIGHKMPIMLTNAGVWNFLSSGLVSEEEDNLNVVDNDVISWEIFRQIISPRLDPLNEERVEFILELIENRQEQIDRLRLKCFSLAEKIKQPKTLSQLPNQIERFIRVEVEKEIADLLKIDKKALDDFFLSIFSDEKTWLAALSFIAGIVSGTTTVTTGAAIATISSLSAKTVQAIGKKKDKLNASDYALVYTIAKRT